MPLITRSVQFSPDAYAALEALAKRQGISINAAIVRAVEQAVQS